MPTLDISSSRQYKRAIEKGEFNTATNIYISNINVDELPDMPSVTRLQLYSLRRLTKLPELPNVDDVRLESLLKITELPEMPRAELIRLFNMPKLKKLPTEFPLVSTVGFDKLKSLENFPELPVATKIYVKDVPLKKLPNKFPWARQVTFAMLENLEYLPDMPSISYLDLICTSPWMKHLRAENFPAIRRITLDRCSIPYLIDILKYFPYGTFIINDQIV